MNELNKQNLENRFYNLLEQYCIEGENRELYDRFKRLGKEELSQILVRNYDGHILSSKDNIKKNIRVRNLNEKELCVIYSDAIKEFDNAILNIKKNKEKGVFRQIDLFDFVYLFKSAIPAGFNDGQPYHDSVSLDFCYGGFETGKRR